MSDTKDKLKVELNPITKTFDLVSEFNSNRIVTHGYNQAGNKLQIFDPISGIYTDMDDLIVTDNEGNVVST